MLVITCVSPLSLSQAWRNLTQKCGSCAGDAGDACHMLAARGCPQKDNQVTVHELWCWRIGPNARAAPGDALPQPGALPLLPTGLSNP